MISPTYTDETVEKIARAICEVPGFYCVQSHGVVPFDHRSDYIQDLLREIARAALSVRPSTGSDAGDLVKRLERHAADFEDEMHALDATVATRIIHKSVRDDIREAAASIAALSEKLRDTEAALAITEAAMDNLEAKWRAGFDEAVAVNAALSEENFALAAATCEAPTMDEYGHQGCLTITVLREENERLKAALEVTNSDAALRELKFANKQAHDVFAAESEQLQKIVDAIYAPAPGVREAMDMAREVFRETLNDHLGPAQDRLFDAIAVDYDESIRARLSSLPAGKTRGTE